MKAAATMPELSVPQIAAELQALQRQRAVFIKSRIMVANRLQAIVAGTLGYHSGMKESERAKSMAQAAKLIKDISNGVVASELHGLVMTHCVGIDEFVRMQDAIDKQTLKLVKQLPVAAWVGEPEQRGFGLPLLAVIIGETGDLNNYANPAKVWRRLGCAPWTHNGATHMGATWRCGKNGKLPKEEWEKFGYSPRRRSIAYLIGEGLVKQNGGVRADEVIGATEGPSVGPYRRRYDEAKALIAEAHPDYPKLRCHLHGMLLATKLLLKNLWIEWNK